MKKLITIASLLIFAISIPGCKQNNTEKPSKPLTEQVSDTVVSDIPEKSPQKALPENQSEGSNGRIIGFDKATEYSLTDTILADFNGDGVLDKAFYKKEAENSGIIIRHGQTKKEVRIGFGEDFSTWEDFNCDWVDYWGLVEDRKTTEVTLTEENDILGSKDVKLQNPSIVLGANELGGGLITFLNGKYVWIHQTC